MILDGKVTIEWLQEQGLTKNGYGEFMQIGVPTDPADISNGVKWTKIRQLSDADYDAIKEYHKLKTA